MPDRGDLVGRLAAIENDMKYKERYRSCCTRIISRFTVPIHNLSSILEPALPVQRALLTLSTCRRPQRQVGS